MTALTPTSSPSSSDLFPHHSDDDNEHLQQQQRKKLMFDKVRDPFIWLKYENISFFVILEGGEIIWIFSFHT